MSIYTQKIEPVFVKHYAPNICLPLNMAKFTQCLISTKKIGLCRKVKQVIYSSSQFQTASSNLADMVEMPFTKVQKNLAAFVQMLGNLLIIHNQLTKFQVPSSNSFRDILLTSLKGLNLQKNSHNSGKI